MINIPFIIDIPVGSSITGAFSHDITQMILHAGPMVKFVIGILLLASIISWAIIFVKFRLLRSARRETNDFLELFSEEKGLKKIYMAGKELDFSPVARLFVAGYAELGRVYDLQATLSPKEKRGTSEDMTLRSRKNIMEHLERRLRKSSIAQMNRLERSLGFLATTGNTAPFIGLFGTVWGIMESFRGIGLTGSANLAVVAPGISEALIATAAGLAAAIPAVVAFNHFTQKISAVGTEMDIFISEFLTMVERQFFKEGNSGSRSRQA
ncbi:MAG: protein TolQ [Desulfobacterales bacterium]|nr:protein TolQ [Desulfobacterales bacterium]